MAEPGREEASGAPSGLKAYLMTAERRLLLPEILFVAGWSLMWATSLQLIPVIPMSVSLVLIVLGLLLLAKRAKRA
jgi:CHASE2 domain-containing sensor protein